jgi:hypothetical protein
MISSGCSIAQLLVCWLAVRLARVRISARYSKDVPLVELPGDEDKQGTGPRRLIMYECEV